MAGRDQYNKIGNVELAEAFFEELEEAFEKTDSAYLVHFLSYEDIPVSLSQNFGRIDKEVIYADFAINLEMVVYQQDFSEERWKTTLFSWCKYYLWYTFRDNLNKIFNRTEFYPVMSDAKLEEREDGIYMYAEIQVFIEE